MIAGGWHVDGVVGAWFCRARTRCVIPVASRYVQRCRPDTPLRRRITCIETAQMKSCGGSAGQGAGDASRSGANSRHRHPSFILEIIGRSTHGVGSQFSAARAHRSVSHPVAVFHQPSRQQGGRSLLQPDIEQFDDLFANVCGMAQPRQFVALERRAGSGKQEIPRRLGFGMTVHVSPHRKTDVTIKLTISNSIEPPPVWKTVENFRAIVRAASAREWSRRASAALLRKAVRGLKLSVCSGCAGDYEDPDAASWTGDFPSERAETDVESEQPAATERFPVRHK